MASQTKSSHEKKMNKNEIVYKLLSAIDLPLNTTSLLERRIISAYLEAYILKDTGKDLYQVEFVCLKAVGRFGTKNFPMSHKKHDKRTFTKSEYGF